MALTSDAGVDLGDSSGASLRVLPQPLLKAVALHPRFCSGANYGMFG